MPTMIIIPAGTRYGRLEVIRGGERLRGSRAYLCKCDCGVQKIVSTRDLRRGHSKSCGCRHAEGTQRKHGHALNGRPSPEYAAWAHMIARCNNPKNKHYRQYGGRGIKVCERWLVFENFLADMGPRPAGRYSLERVKNHRGYYSRNCVWCPSQKVQMRNTRRNVYVLVKGKRMCFKDAAQVLGLSYARTRCRYWRGYSIERAFDGLARAAPT